MAKQNVINSNFGSATNGQIFVVDSTQSDGYRFGLRSTYANAAAPTVNDDSGDGFVPGSQWLDTTNDLLYYCVDNTLGAAIWKLVPNMSVAGNADFQVGGVSQFSSSSAGCKVRGENNNTAVSAGFIGEVIGSTLAVGSAVTLSDNTLANVTSISVTAGKWLISCSAVFRATGANAGTTQLIAAMGTTSASLTGTVMGETQAQLPVQPVNGISDVSVVIPGFSIALSTTTTYFLVVRADNSSTFNMSAYGRIQAVRIA